MEREGGMWKVEIGMLYIYREREWNGMEWLSVLYIVLKFIIL